MSKSMRQSVRKKNGYNKCYKILVCFHGECFLWVVSTRKRWMENYSGGISELSVNLWRPICGCGVHLVKYLVLPLSQLKKTFRGGPNGAETDHISPLKLLRQHTWAKIIRWMRQMYTREGTHIDNSNSFSTSNPLSVTLLNATLYMQPPSTQPAWSSSPTRAHAHIIPFCMAPSSAPFGPAVVTSVLSVVGTPYLTTSANDPLHGTSGGSFLKPTCLTPYIFMYASCMPSKSDFQKSCFQIILIPQLLIFP